MKTIKLMVATTAALACQASMAFDPAFAMAGKDVKRTDDMTFGTGDLASASPGFHVDAAGGLQNDLRGTNKMVGGATMTSVGNGDSGGGGGSISTAINVAGLTSIDALDIAMSRPNGHVENASIAGAAGHIAPA